MGKPQILTLLILLISIDFADTFPLLFNVANSSFCADSWRKFTLREMIPYLHAPTSLAADFVPLLLVDSKLSP